MQPLKNASERSLIQQLRLRDEAAFGELYQRYWRLLFAHVYKMLSDEQDAKDIVQDIFGNLWNNAANLSDDIHLSGYLYQAGRNRVINLIRHRKNQSAYLDSLAQFMDGASMDTLDELAERDLAEALEREIQHLPPRMRQVFELSRKENLSYQEIADRLGISHETVKKQMHKSLKVIRKNLGRSHGLSLLFLLFLR